MNCTFNAVLANCSGERGDAYKEFFEVFSIPSKQDALCALCPNINLELAVKGGEGAIDLQQLVGAEYGLATITNTDINRSGLISIYFQMKPAIVNDSKSFEIANYSNDLYNIRVTQGGQFEIKFGYDADGGFIFRMYRAHSGNYNHRGYHHIAEDACLGTWRRTFEDLANAGAGIPFAVVMTTVVNFLVHRNHEDAAGEWMRYDDEMLSSRYARANGSDFGDYRRLAEQMERCNGEVYTWGEVTEEQLNHRITKMLEEKNIEPTGGLSKWILPEIEF